jgi:hypothetical protein
MGCSESLLLLEVNLELFGLLALLQFHHYALLLQLVQEHQFHYPQISKKTLTKQAPSQVVLLSALPILSQANSKQPV